jgi:hypothetical protein
LATAVKDADLVVLEKVGGFVGGGAVCSVCKQAKNLSPGSSMFNFGRGVGVIVGCLLAIGARFEEVTPQHWQSVLSLHRKKGMSQDDWKRELKVTAQKMYPEVKVTLSVADAILIPRYAMLCKQGFVEAVPME